MASIKIKSLLQIIVLVFFSYTCTSCIDFLDALINLFGENEQTENPEDNIEWEPVGEVEFGKTGGTAEFEEISITVDPGVFYSDTKFNIEKSTTPIFDSENAITDVFLFEIDNQSKSNIEFQVRLNANKDFEISDSISLLVGFQSENLYNDSTSWSLLPMNDIKIEGNQIIGNLNFSIEKNLKSSKLKNRGIILPTAAIAGLSYLVVQGYKSYISTTSKSGNFKVYGHWVNKVPNAEVADAFDYAWEKLEKLEFDPKRIKGTRSDMFWPFTVYLYPEGSGWGFSLAKNESGYFCPKITRNLDCILIKDKNLKGLTVKKVSGHEFFHAVQSTYNHEDYDNYLWLGEASSNWFELYLSKIEGKSHTPLNFYNDTAFYENGLNGVNAKKLDNHGYGYFIFLSYLTDLYGDKLIKDIWAAVENQSTGMHNSAVALQTAVSKKSKDPFAIVYQDFILNYFMGKINSINDDFDDFLKNGIIIKEWDVSKEEIEDSKAYKAIVSLPDFSANIFKINFAPDVKNAENTKSFGIEIPDIDPYVCAYILNKEGEEKVQIAKISKSEPKFNFDLAEYAGKSVYILVVNTNNNGEFSGSKDIIVSSSNAVELKINPNPISGSMNNSISLTAESIGSLPADVKYVWSFGDGSSSISVNNKNTVEHTFSKEGEFTVTVELFDNSNNKQIAKASAKATISGEFLVFLQKCETASIELAGTHNTTAGYPIEFDYKNEKLYWVFPVEWQGSTFTVNILLENKTSEVWKSYNETTKLVGTISQDGLTLENFSVNQTVEVTYIDETYHSFEKKLEGYGIPRTVYYKSGWVGILNYKLEGSELRSHISKISYSSISKNEKGELTEQNSYSSTDWNSTSNPPYIEIVLSFQ